MIRCLLICLIHLPIAAQNLVANGGFEEKVFCPVGFNQQRINSVQHWWQATDGTPDYFHKCSKGIGIPDNFTGHQEAFEGEAYTGLVTFSNNKKNYREYLQSKLTRALKAGEMVCIEFRFSAAENCLFIADGLGVTLTHDKITARRHDPIACETAMINPRFHMLDEKEQWVLMSDLYTAKGGEEYITIGNFMSDKELRIIRRTHAPVGQQGGWSYLYIDDIHVTPVKQRNECSCSISEMAAAAVDPPLELQEYTLIKLDNVLFDFDQDILTDSALKQMKGVYQLLKKNPYFYLEVSGHTDIKGGDEYNMELSRRRAEQVIQYLRDRGIDESRLKLSYHGFEEPVANNDTDEGRRQNRRVEFRVLKNSFELIQ
jgi:outer membrane protein OmpA-like peptidoglycan-associated protein